MIPPSWDQARAKAQIRLAAQRVVTQQQKLESAARTTRKDISVLLQQNDVQTARFKAEKLDMDSQYCDLLSILETYCELLVERFEVFQDESEKVDRPVLIAICGILAAAGRTEVKELHVLKEIIQERYPELIPTADRLHPSLVAQLRIPKATPAQIDDLLAAIAKEYNVVWSPPNLPPHQKLRVLEEMLNPSSPMHSIDIHQLREICSRGLPSEPAWFRPRIWKLLLGTLPAEKSQWEAEKRKLRDLYYDLARKFLDDLTSKPPPEMTLTAADATLLSFSKDLTRLPPLIKDLLDEEETDPSPDCPLSPTCLPERRIMNADAVNQRLEMIRNRGKPHSEEPVQLEPPPTPSITVSSPTSPPPNRPFLSMHHSRMSSGSKKTLLGNGTQPTYKSSVLRLLYVHTSVNPAHVPTNLVSILAPLYATMMEEVDSEEIAHIEADTFWLFAELLSEVGEIVGVEGTDVQGWLTQFGDRLRWADSELYGDLKRKGLDPALPHYSYAWLPNLLTFTIPLVELLPLWDGILTMPRRTSDDAPKIDFFLDLCVALLIKARLPLMRVGKPSQFAGLRSLWGEENLMYLAKAPVKQEPEFGDAFMEGIKFLQAYPLEELGGSERALEAAFDLHERRLAAAAARSAAPANTGIGGRIRGAVWGANAHPESDDDGNATETPNSGATGFGRRLQLTVWKGFTNQMDSPVPSPDPSPDASRAPTPDAHGSPVEPHDQVATPPAPLGLGAKIRKSVWNGLTNQEDSPPSSPTPPPTPHPDQTPVASANGSTEGSEKSTGFWGSVRNFQESDAAASLSKAGSSVLASIRSIPVRQSTLPTSIGTSNDTAAPAAAPSTTSWLGKTTGLDLFAKRGSLAWPLGGQAAKVEEPEESRRGSYPIGRKDSKGHNASQMYSPPPRPVFKSVRDSWVPKGAPFSSPNSPESVTSPTSSDGTGSVKASKPITLQSTLAALTGSSGSPQATPAKPKSGPRPLILNSSALITPASGSPASGIRSGSPLPNRASVLQDRGPFSRNRRSTQSIDLKDPSGFVPLRRGPLSARAARQRESESSVTSSSSRFSQPSVDGESSGTDSRRVSLSQRSASSGYIVDLGDDVPLHQRKGSSPVMQQHPLAAKARHGRTTGSQDLEIDIIDENEHSASDERPAPASVESSPPAVDSTDSDMPLTNAPTLLKTSSRVRGKRANSAQTGLRLRTSESGRSNSLGSPASAGLQSAKSPRRATHKSPISQPVIFSEEEGVKADDEEEPYSGLLDAMTREDDDD